MHEKCDAEKDDEIIFYFVFIQGVSNTNRLALVLYIALALIQRRFS